MTPPKVLIVNGEPFNRLSATGITMSNLFLGWPPERLGQVFTADMAADSIAKGCEVRLSRRDLIPFSMLRRRAAKPVTATERPGKHPYTTGEDRSRTLARKAISPFLEFLPYDIPADAMARIRHFKPDVIYSMLGSMRIVSVAASLSRQLEIPIVPHFMDDWLATYTVPGRSVGTSLHVRCLNAGVMRLFERVPLALAIGDMMAEEYSQRFSRKFFSVMNPVDVDPAFPRDAMTRKDKIVRLVYVGGLHLGRVEVLADISKAVRDAETAGYAAALDIYAPASDAPAALRLEAIAPIIRYRGSIPPDQVRAVLDQSDVAIHVEAFSKECATYTRLSVSTKIPQYLAAGIPVLAYGPKTLASCRYVHDTGCGVHVGTQGQARLGEAMRELIGSEQLRRELGYRGWQRAKDFHEGQLVRGNFRDLLALAAATGLSRT